jgi:pyroglutamyl-peptidase
MKILLTGFNSFSGVRVNPSELVVRAIAEQRQPRNVEVITAVLPTEYGAATRQLRGLIRRHRPDAVICLGVAQRRETISLERVALNLDDEPTPDNARVVRRGSKIERGGPDLYWSTLPLAALERALNSKPKTGRVRAVISNHAGAFLCNHAFYIARHETARRRRPIPCGFIHLPGLRGRKAASERQLSGMIEAVGACLSVVCRELAKPRR